MLAYPVLLIPDSNRALRVEFPDVPEANTFGRNEADALRRAVDALESALSFYIDSNEALPKPGRKRKRMVVPSPLSTAKLELYRTWRDSGMRKTDLAKKIGIAKTNVDRLFDLRHKTRLDLIERAFHALGKRLVIAVADAA